MSWPRGRGLGGSSLINFMIHARGSLIDYDRWAELGNTGWSGKDMLIYFKKLEDTQVRYQEAEFRGTGGEVTNQDVSYRTKSSEVFVEACKELGYQYVDYNGHQQIGVSHMQGTTRRGLRCSGEKAYLQPAKFRPNLTIKTGCFVTKVLMEGNRAIGVEYERYGLKFEARATKEVILSAGVLSSPKLLMLSGIGPRDDLRKFNIPLVKNLPVGRRLMDHLLFLGAVFLINADIDYDNNLSYNPGSYAQLYLNGTGPLTMPGGIEVITYFRSNVSTDPDVNYADLEFLLTSLRTSYDQRVLRITQEVYDVLYGPIENRHALIVYPVLLQAESIGYVKLRSRDPHESLIHHGNYFTDPTNHDMRVMIAGVREIQRIFNTEAFRRYDPQQVLPQFPACRDEEVNSDAYWECAIRSVTSTIHHQMGTCKMGPETDPEAVVDERLRVHGVRNLRVADTSIIPMSINGHPNIPMYAVGERVSDFIKYYWLDKNT